MDISEYHSKRPYSRMESSSLDLLGKKASGMTEFHILKAKTCNMSSKAMFDNFYGQPF